MRSMIPRGGMTGVFSDKVRRAEDNEAEAKELHVPLTGNTCLHV